MRHFFSSVVVKSEAASGKRLGLFSSVAWLQLRNRVHATMISPLRALGHEQILISSTLDPIDGAAPSHSSHPSCTVILLHQLRPTSLTVKHSRLRLVPEGEISSSLAIGSLHKYLPCIISLVRDMLAYRYYSTVLQSQNFGSE